MKKYNLVLAFIILLVSFASCGGGSDSSQEAKVPPPIEAPKADPKGIGEVRNVNLTDPLEESMIVTGKAISEMKCAACHKLTDQRVVGPGWAGITNKRRPEWIMNMITNVEVMLDEDPVAQKLLEECLTRMPNQSVSIGDARAILEYMRKNDMDQVGKKDEAAL
ncbi:c-type cytochrome [Fulvivirgaceae bacterium LMO-SS25]